MRRYTYTFKDTGKILFTCVEHNYVDPRMIAADVHKLTGVCVNPLPSYIKCEIESLDGEVTSIGVYDSNKRMQY